MKYFAFELGSAPGHFVCRSIASWPMTKEQIQLWALRSDVEVEFVHQAQPGPRRR